MTLPKMKKSPFPEFFTPQLATLVNTPPTGNQWLHEIKLDGYRILAFKQEQKVVLKSRNNKDWTQELALVAENIGTLPYKNLVFDGEVVLLDKEGKSNFQRLQNAIKDDAQAPFVYYVFDLLYFENYDLKKLPLLTRKEILKQVLTAQKNKVLHYSDHILSDGEEVFSQSCNFALEGIVSKRIDSTYHTKRTKNWLKIKCMKRQEFVIGGYSDPKGGRKHFGSLFLGVFNAEKELIYTGNVGTGFTQKSLQEIYSHLSQMQSSTTPFHIRPPHSSKAHWLKPVLVCEVEFSAWTQDGHLRHPSFKGLRLDKKAAQVVREYEIPLKEVKTMDKEPISKKTNFIISHPKKILYPEDNISKEDLLKYYTKISDYILPYIKERPLTLVRCPSQYQDCFYQRHYNEATPKGLYPVFLEDNKTDEYLYLKDEQGLLQLVQLGVLEIHPWGSRIQHLEQPDLIILDLDPAADVTWAEVIAAAFEIKEHLGQLKLNAFVKSTGGKGLHVVIPIKPQHSWDEIKGFAHAFVELLEQLKPQKYISKMNKSKRSGKIFIDYLRNQRTATAIAPYSTRARLHAPISTPLAWEELKEDRQKNSYTIKTLLRRLAHLKEDPWKNFWEIKQSLDLDAFKC